MDLPKFTMLFEPTTIEHLGLKLYSALPPVIAELVSNGYDAEAPKVEIQVPEGDLDERSEVIVRDYGHGMSPQEVQDEYLPIGRKRRGEDGKSVLSKHNKVRVTGRKGLGKLAALGIADRMEVRAVHEGAAVCLRVEYDALMKWPRENPGRPYEPEVVPERTGFTTEEEGVEVRLSHLRRRSPIKPGELRKALARRLAMIGPKFEVRVNGTPIGPGDRRNREECADGFSWDVSELPHGGTLTGGLAVTGWIGFTEKSSQAERDRGVDIFANGKAAELGSFLNYASTHSQFARAYLVGEIHADFLDAEEDLVSTARTSVVWESKAGSALEQWGHDTLSWAFGQWVDLRRKKKETQVIQAAKFDVWLAGREPREQKVAQRILKVLTADEKLAPDSMIPLLEIVKDSVETIAFHDLVADLESGVSTETLLRLFAEWRVIEARELVKLSDGRRAGIAQLERYMREGAHEVKELSPLFRQHPWLIDQSWKDVDFEKTFTALLKEQFPEDEERPEVDRRLDILAFRPSGYASVVELKHPKKTLTREDLDQVTHYVDWLRSRVKGTGTDSPKGVRGLLLVGSLGNKADVLTAMERLAASDIRVEIYADLKKRAEEYYGEAEQRLKEIAPEYVKRRNTRRKDG